jgi:MYXO-CTERM domain-containing protein
MTYRCLPVLAALAAALPASALASAPAGVWSRVDKVEPLADPNKPTMVRIDGLFIVAGGQPDFADYPGYGEPQAGYMYYECGAKDLDVCTMEWAELLAIAGTDDNCRGWGDVQLGAANGSVRPSGDPLAKPDAWPIAMGIVAGFAPCEALKAWQPSNETTTGEPDTDTAGETSTGEPGTSGEPSTGGGCGILAECASESGGPPVGDSTGPGESSGGVDPTTGGTTGGPGGTTDAGATDTAGATSDGVDDDGKSGCACDARAPAPPLALLALAGLGLLRRRRR